MSNTAVIDKIAYRLMKSAYYRKRISDKQFQRIVGKDYANSYLFTLGQNGFLEVTLIDGRRFFRLSPSGRAAFEKARSEKRQNVLKAAGEITRAVFSAFRP